MYDLELEKIEVEMMVRALARKVKEFHKNGKISGIGAAAVSDKNREWWNLERATSEMPYDYKMMASAIAEIESVSATWLSPGQVRGLLRGLEFCRQGNLVDKVRKQVKVQGYTDLIEAPEVGMPATYYVGTDRYGGVISFVKRKGREVGFQSVERWRTDKNGQSEQQTWEHDLSKPDHHSEKLFTLRQDGYYRPKGSQYQGSIFLRIGILDSYKDPSF